MDATASKTPPRTDDLQGEALYSLIDEFFQIAPPSHFNTILTKLWLFYSVNGIGDGTGSNTAIYKVTSKQLDEIHSLMVLMNFLTEAGEAWATIGSKKEVGRD